MEQQPIKITATLKEPITPPAGKDLVALAKAASKHIHDEVKRWPQSTLGVVEGARGGGYYNVKRWNGATMRDVWDATADGGTVENNTTVVVRFYNSDPDKPYIKSQGGASHSDTPEEGEVDIPIVDVRAGMWFQTGGFWWEPWSTAFFQIPMSITPEYIEEVETFGPYAEDFPADPQTFGGSDESNFVVIIPRNLPPRFTGFEVLQILIDGEDLTAYYGGKIYYAENPWTVTISPFSDPIDQPTLPSEALEVEITYRYLAAVNNTLASGSAGEGPDKALSPRGIAMFPATVGADAQIAAVLQTTYQADGGEVSIVDEFESSSPSTGVFAYALSYTAVPGSLDPESNITGISTAHTLYLPAPYDTVYALAQSNILYNSDILITYQIDNPSAGMPEDFFEDFVADGVTASFTLTVVTLPNPSMLLNSVYDFSIAAFDALASINTTTGEVTLSYTPTAGADIQVSVNADPAATVDQTDTFPPPGIGVQTAFTLTETPATGSTFTVPDYPAYGAFNFDPFATGTPEYNPVPLHPLYSSGVVRFAFQNNSSDISADLSYKRERVFGNLFHITGQTIREFNATTNSGYQTLTVPYPTPYDATPVSPFLAFHGSGNISTALGDRWQDGWVQLRWGFLTYDVVTDVYTVVSPVGVFWRKRSASAVEGDDWTLMPWPSESDSADKAFAGYAWDTGSESGTIDNKHIKRRTAPWLGVGVASRFMLQGSWAPVGPNLIAQTDSPPSESVMPLGLPSDTDFFLRFFQRNNDLHLWGLVNELSVRKLTPHPDDTAIYIPGSGLMHLEGNTAQGVYPKGWAAGRPNTGDNRNSWWPATRNGEFWVIACGWCKADWLANQEQLLTERTTFEDYKVGLDDAGLTLNSINNQGVIVDTLTFKCSKAIYEQGYADADLSQQVDYALAHADDQFNDPGLPGVPPGKTFYFGMTTEYAASASFGYWPRDSVDDYVYFYYSLDSLDSETPKLPNLQYPGIPALGGGSARIANDLSGSGHYGTIKNEDNFQSQQISLGPNNTIYLVISEPTFVGGLHTVKPFSTKTLTDTTTSSVSVPSGDAYATYFLTGWEGSPLITSVTNTTWLGVSIPNFQAGIVIPFSELAHHRAVEEPSGASSPFTIETTWAHTYPDPAYCAFRDYKLRSDTTNNEFYLQPGFSDFYPVGGAVRFYLVGDHRQDVAAGSKTLLKKIGITSEGKFDPKWELDISTFAPTTLLTTHIGGTIYPTAVSSHRPVFYTLARGRFIFILRLVPQPVEVSPPQTPAAPYLDYLVLEIYENGDVAPTTPIWRIWLPNPGVGDGITATLEPPTAAVLADLAIPDDLVMHVGQRSDGREWAILAGTLGGVAPYYFLVKCPTLISDDPTMRYTADSTGLPDPTEVIGMAQAGDLFVWCNDDMEIVNRSGG